MNTRLPILDIPAIHRSTGFNANTVANLARWVKADDLATLFQDSTKTTPVTANGDVVGAWVDQITGQYTQTVTGAKPIYRSSVAALGNRPALEFDGSGDNLVNSAAFTVDPMTIFVVAVSDLVGGTKHILSETQASTNRFHIAANATVFETRRFTGSYASGNQTAAEDTNGNIIMVQLNTTCNLWKNGTAGTGAGASVTNATTHSQIGANTTTNFFDGHIAEILIYNAALAAANLNLVQDYLAAKYSISVTRFS